MSPFIRITRTPYEEPYHLHLLLEVSDGVSLGVLEYYDNAAAFKEWADALETFPQHINAVFLHEIGSERPEDRNAFYLRLRAFTTEGLGHCAIQFRMNNNAALPFRSISEFCVRAEAADVNRFGHLCREFALLKHEVLHWRVTEGELYESRTEADQSLAGDARSART